MNKLFVALVAAVFCLAVPSLASAGGGSVAGDQVGGAPVYCGAYPDWEDDSVGEGSVPGYPGDDYDEEGGVDTPDDSDSTDPVKGVDEGDTIYCADDMTTGGPKTWKHPRSAKAERIKAQRRAAKNRAAKHRAIKAKRARVQARKMKARKAARKQARAQANRRG